MSKKFSTKSLEILNILRHLFKPYKGRLFFLFIIMFISGIFESLNLAALYPVMNYGLKQESQGVISQVFNFLLSVLYQGNLFLSSCILLIIITILAVGAKLLNSFISYRMMLSIVSRYQKAIFDKFINSDYDFFLRNQQGRLIYLGTIASKQAGSMVLYAITAVSDFLALAVMFSLLVLLSWKGAILIIIIGAFYFLTVKQITKKVIYKSGQLLLRADREKNITLNELITGIKTIKVFRMFKAWEDKYHDAVNKSMYNQFRMLIGRVFPESFMKFTLYVFIAVLGIFLSLKTDGDMISKVPLYGTFALVVSRLFPAIQKVGSDLMVLAAALPNTKAVYDLLNEDTSRIKEGGNVLEGFHSDISFRDVWFRFSQSNEFLFNGIDFSIEKNKMTAIVGPSGYGKTTLINLLLRLYPVSRGRITIDGVDINEYTLASYLSKIGYVGQETFIFNDTIFENIKFGFDNCSRDMVIEAAKQANAHDFIIATDKGYDTIVGDAGMKLSGGQRQRIAIARAMLRKPEIMVLDEATSSLDNIAEEKVQDAINNISQYTTVVVVAHRLSTIQGADKILVLDRGKVVEQGKHDSLLDKKGIYYNLYNRQLIKR